MMSGGYRALEPGCEILMFMWPFGPLNMDSNVILTAAIVWARPSDTIPSCFLELLTEAHIAKVYTYLHTEDMSACIRICIISNMDGHSSTIFLFLASLRGVSCCAIGSSAWKNSCRDSVVQAASPYLLTQKLSVLWAHTIPNHAALG